MSAAVITCHDSLSAAQRAALTTLLTDAETHDGVLAWNEQARLDLAAEPRPGLTWALAHDGAELVGALHHDGETAQLVVSPAARRRGIATALREALPTTQVWAFGDLPAARATAAAWGLTPARGLLIMERDVADIPPAQFPAGVGVRPFTEADIDAFLRVNSRAFAHHPEQGAMTAADVRARMAEPWFDANGFLLATDLDQVVGFHWTKRHDPTTGEVYVIGIDPDQGGRGLGRQLLHAGLAHLRDQGVSRIILYVEADATKVVALYRSARFDVIHRDVLYAGGSSVSPAAEESL